jgi:hypothetical protein
VSDHKRGNSDGPLVRWAAATATAEARHVPAVACVAWRPMAWQYRMLVPAGRDCLVVSRAAKYDSDTS